MRAFMAGMTVRDVLAWARYFRAKSGPPAKAWIRDADEIERMAIQLYG